MMKDAVKIEIVDLQPTHVEIKFVSNEHTVQLGRNYFSKRVQNGFYEVVNKQKIPAVL